jgi:hypothetical protein
MASGWLLKRPEKKHQCDVQSQARLPRKLPASPVEGSEPHELDFASDPNKQKRNKRRTLPHYQPQAV